MMLDAYPKIAESLSRIIDAVQKERNLLVFYPKTEMESRLINAENLIDLAANHLV